jgi:hypothetical protein
MRSAVIPGTSVRHSRQRQVRERAPRSTTMSWRYSMVAPQTQVWVVGMGLEDGADD